ncbi:MAG: glycosyltransferase family 39 protein, partial [Bacteroidetes bacterium]|nr:glycosyltransferase family 39 protein [Bacteroidota bacterium]
MNKTKTQQTKLDQSPSILPYIILGIGFLIVAFIRYRLLSVPLERDEAGFAYMAQQLLKGYLPYTTALDSKPPGLYVLVAGFLSIFGHTASGFHAGLMLMSLGSMAFLFFIGKRLGGVWMGVASSLFFGFVGLSISTLGFAAHATHFVAFFLIAGLYFLLKAKDSKQLLHFIISGLLFGLCFLMKQPGGVFPVMGFLSLLILAISQKENIKTATINLVSFILASAFPFLLFVAWFAAKGHYVEFYKMVFGVTATYAGKLSFSEGMDGFSHSFPAAMGSFTLVWLLALAGLVMAILSKDILLKTLLIALAVFSFIATTPGYYFREHYFVVMLPAVALCAAYLIQFLFDFVKNKSGETLGLVVVFMLMLVAIGYGVNDQKKYLFSTRTDQIARQTYAGNPFAEAVEIGKYIKDNSAPTDKIAVMGSEPEIYFYAQREAATKYIFTYGMLDSTTENIRMVAEMEAEIEKAKP